MAVVVNTKGEQWRRVLLYWAETAYAIYQREFDVKSWELIETLALTGLERVFPVLYQTVWESTVDNYMAK
jgi:hypothetical protein